MWGGVSLGGLCVFRVPSPVPPIYGLWIRGKLLATATVPHLYACCPDGHGLTCDTVNRTPVKCFLLSVALVMVSLHFNRKVIRQS